MSKLDGIVLLSGGMDSATVLAIAIKEYNLVPERIGCLSVAYGSRHSVLEQAAAHQVAESFGIDRGNHVFMGLDPSVFGSDNSLTNASKEVEGFDDAQQVKDYATRSPVAAPLSTYVPARNLVLLSLATAFAVSRNCARVFIGIVEADGSNYPDCRMSFLRCFERAAYEASPDNQTAAEFLAPLIQMSKKDIVRTALELGVPLELTWTCYNPQNPSGNDGQWLACGQCSACRLRKEGFDQANQVDPVKYVQ